MKSIRDLIKSNIINETNQSVDIDDTNFFVELANSKNKNGNSKILNFSLLIFVFIIGIVFVINSGIYFIKDVLGTENECKITPEGAVVTNMASNKEFYLFLFNASEPWTNSGIQLAQGDKIKIQVSGGFHSDAIGLYYAAENNFKPFYDWISMADTSLRNKSKDTTLVCSDAKFGNLIYRIGEKSSKTYYLSEKKDKFIKIKNNGNLFLSVNEAKPLKENTESDDYHSKMMDTVTYKRFHKNKSADYYKDNIGQILVAIEVQREINPIYWKKEWYRDVENNVISIWCDDSCMAWKTVKTIIYMVYAVFGAIFLFTKMLFWTLWFLTIPCFIVFLWYFQKTRLKIAFGKCKMWFAKLFIKA